MEEKIVKTIKALQSRQFDVHYAENADEAKKLLATFIKPGMTIGTGGSLTLQQLNFRQIVKEQQGILLDHLLPNLTQEERIDICRQHFSCDLYCCSSNALTEQGQLLNIDGTGNRVSAMIFGPKKVVIVIGVNKIVEDLDAAYWRLKNIVAPQNCKRLQRNTPCVKKGHCVDCKSIEKICRVSVVLEEKPLTTDIKIILVNENLGY